MLIPFSTILSKYKIKPTGILHVGAHFAEEADDYRKAGIHRVLWVEAQPDSYEVLKEKLKRYAGHKCIRACVGDEDGKEVTFNVANNEGQSSSYLELGTHKVAHKEVEYIANYKLKTVRLDTLLNFNKIKMQDYDFINFDLQCAELPALKGMGDLLHKINYAYLEVNVQELYVGCNLLPEVEAYMQGFGFEIKELKLTNFGWGDAFFIRK